MSDIDLLLKCPSNSNCTYHLCCSFLIPLSSTTVLHFLYHFNNRCMKSDRQPMQLVIKWIKLHFQLMRNENGNSWRNFNWRVLTHKRLDQLILLKLKSKLHVYVCDLLNWFSVSKHIEFKISVRVYLCQIGSSPLLRVLLPYLRLCSNLPSPSQGEHLVPFAHILTVYTSQRIASP